MRIFDKGLRSECIQNYYSPIIRQAIQLNGSRLEQPLIKEDVRMANMHIWICLIGDQKNAKYPRIWDTSLHPWNGLMWQAWQDQAAGRGAPGTPMHYQGVRTGVPTSQNTVTGLPEETHSLPKSLHFHSQILPQVRAHIDTKTCAQMSLTALFITARRGDNPNAHHQVTA